MDHDLEIGLFFYWIAKFFFISQVLNSAKTFQTVQSQIFADLKIQLL